MAHEDSRNAKENSDAGSERAVVAPIGAVAANLDSALAQLNVSSAFGRVRESSVDLTREYLRHEKPTPASGKMEIITPSAAPPATAEGKVASRLSNGRVKEQEKERNQDVAHKPSRLEKPNFEKPDFDPPGERIVIAAVSAAPSEPAAAEADDPPVSLPDAAHEPGGARKLNVASANEIASPREAKFGTRGGQIQSISVGSTPTHYQSALLQIIESAANDPRQLRRLIYELARAKLNNEIGQGGTALGPDEIQECLLALETAIARVEADLSRGARSEPSLAPLAPEPEAPERGSLWEKFQEMKARNPTDQIGPASVAHLESERPRALGVVPPPAWPRPRPVRGPQGDGSQQVALSAGPAARPAVEIVYPERDKADAVRVRRRVWLWFIVWPLIQLIGPAVFCLVLYLALAGKLDVQQAQTRQAKVAEARQSAAAEAAHTSEFPLPSTYGVYAVSNGQLSELQSLPIRAPDPRVQLSAEINKPSSSILANGKVVFVLFRRDLLNSAPQKIAVRVVARVAQTLTFSSGKAAAAKPDASWHIRGNSYEFQVSPLNENREMVVARPVDPEFSFPSGRYALVFGGLAYDFTVDGPVTEPVQCLESFEAVSGPVFTECRPK